MKKYILFVLILISGLAVGNEKVQTGIKILIEVVKNLPDDIVATDNSATSDSNP